MWEMAAKMAVGAFAGTRADAHKVCSLHGAKVTFSTTHTNYLVIPYCDHYAHHPSLALLLLAMALNRSVLMRIDLLGSALL